MIFRFHIHHSKTSHLVSLELFELRNIFLQMREYLLSNLQTWNYLVNYNTFDGSKIWHSLLLFSPKNMERFNAH